MNISDTLLLTSLRLLCWAARGSKEVVKTLLAHDGALQELLDYLRYPHRGIKVQVTGLLAEVRAKIGSKGVLRQSKEIFQWVLVEFVNQNLVGPHDAKKFGEK